MPTTGSCFREQSSTQSCLGCRLISTTIIGITGVQAQSFSRLQSQQHSCSLFGLQAYRRDSYQIQVAVRCERQAVIVVEHRAHLSVSRQIVYISARSVAQAVGVIVQLLLGLFRRHISTVSYLFRSQAYQYNSYLVCRLQAYRHNYLS